MLKTQELISNVKEYFLAKERYEILKSWDYEKEMIFYEKKIKSFLYEFEKLCEKYGKWSIFYILEEQLKQK